MSDKIVFGCLAIMLVINFIANCQTYDRMRTAENEIHELRMDIECEFVKQAGGICQ